MENCVFCKIRKGEIPSTCLYKDNDMMIIKDINPQAKIHLVAIPNIHVPSIDMMTSEGKACRLYTTPARSTVNGMDAWESFEMLYYAG